MSAVRLESETGGVPVSAPRNPGVFASSKGHQPVRTSSARQFAILTGLIFLPLVACLGFASTAQAVDNGALGVRPATEADSFHLDAAAGTTLEEIALVKNGTSSPVTLLTYVVDGTTNPQGLLSLGSQDSTSIGLGLWTTLTTPSITVPPMTEKEVPFSINIPVGTTPGDYIGGLIIQAPTQTGQVSSDANGTPVRIDVVNRQGVRIMLNVAGQAVTKLDAGALSWAQSGDDVTVTLPVTNSGNTTLNPRGSVVLASAVGANTTLAFTTPDSIFPGATVELHATLSPAAFIQIGTITAEVTSAAPAITQSTSFVNIPWWIIVGAVAILALIGLLVRRQLLFSRKARLAFARLEALDA